jgi:hypothetical protein
MQPECQIAVRGLARSVDSIDIELALRSKVSRQSESLDAIDIEVARTASGKVC